MTPKILILGHARHGKDEVASILKKEYDLKFESSSEFANKLFIFETLKEKYGYKTEKECFEDRVNHREEWKQLICNYNKEDKSRLAKDIFKENDIYVGLRDLEEYLDIIKNRIPDIVVYIDAGKRCGGYSDPTMSIEPHMEGIDYIIPNNSSLEYLKGYVTTFFMVLLPNRKQKTMVVDTERTDYFTGCLKAINQLGRSVLNTNGVEVRVYKDNGKLMYDE